MAHAKTTAKKILGLKRQQIALALRLKGYTYYQIGTKLKVSYVSAWHYVQEAMKTAREEMSEDVEKVRDLEVNRLDAMLERHWPRRQDPRTSDTILKIMDRRAKLLGLDVPTKTDVNVTGLEKMTDDDLIKMAEQVMKKAKQPSGEEG